MLSLWPILPSGQTQPIDKVQQVENLRNDLTRITSQYGRDLLYYPFIDLTKNQRFKIYTFLEALNTKETQREISQLIRDDLNNPYSEHGGIVKFNFGRLKFENRESAFSSLNDIENNDSYRPKDGWINDCFARYHLHALFKNSSLYSFPSIVEYKDGELAGDLYNSKLFAQKNGEDHAIVITPKGDSFNVDYYSTTISSGIFSPLRKAKSLIVDLGDYPISPSP